MYKVIGRSRYGHLYEIDGLFTLESASAFILRAHERARKCGHFVWLDVSLVLDA